MRVKYKRCQAICNKILYKSLAALPQPQFYVTIWIAKKEKAKEEKNAAGRKKYLGLDCPDSFGCVKSRLSSAGQGADSRDSLWLFAVCEIWHRGREQYGDFLCIVYGDPVWVKAGGADAKGGLFDGAGSFVCAQCAVVVLLESEGGVCVKRRAAPVDVEGVGKDVCVLFVYGAVFEYGAARFVGAGAAYFGVYRAVD